MDVGNFLQFESAFQRDEIVQAAAQEERVLAGTIPFGEDFDLLRVFQHGVNLFGNLPQVTGQGTGQFVRQLTAQAADVDAQHEHNDELRRVGFRRRDSDFRACVGVDDLVGLAGDGRAHDVRDSHRTGAKTFGFAQGGQGIARLAGLADDNHEAARIHQGIAVAEFTGNVRFHRDPGEFLQIVFADKTGVVRRAAGNDKDLLDAPQVRFRPVQLGEIDGSLFLAQAAAHGLADGLRLFVNLLQHEMLEAALFRRFGIPRDVVDFLIDGIAVQVFNPDRVLRDDGNLPVAHDIRAARMANNRRNIGRNEVFPFAQADDQRIVFFGGDELVRLVGAQEDQGVGPVDPADYFLDRAQEIPVVLIRHQVGYHFRIRIGREPMAFFQQIFLQFQIVFNDTVVDDDEAPRFITMGMGVPVRRPAVRRPAGMADADRALGFVALDLDAQGLQTAHTFFDVDAFAVIDSDARGIIPAVFQFAHSVQQDGTSLLIANITYNTTHSGPPVDTDAYAAPTLRDRGVPGTARPTFYLRHCCRAL